MARRSLTVVVEQDLILPETAIGLLCEEFMKWQSE